MSGEESAPNATRRVRVAFGLSYDGSSFHGFAPQPGQRTVAGVLYSALSQMVGEEVVGTCAGRTDTGVHATGQVVHVDLDAEMLEKRFKVPATPGQMIPSFERGLSSICAPEMSVWVAMVVPDDFHARYSATARRYRYEIDTSARFAPLRRHGAWHIDHELDLSLLRLASDALVGQHDFSAFCRRPADKPCASLVRRVSEASWEVTDTGQFLLHIEANAFCHQMVRSIVGALVSVGEGRMRPNELVRALQDGDRSQMPAVAPPQGLCLTQVFYPKAFGFPTNVPVENSGP